MSSLLLALALLGAPQAAPAGRVAPLPSVKAVLALPALHAKGLHVVHFWATWCEPCLDELPEFFARSRELSAKGVDFTFISVDDADADLPPLVDKLGGFFPGARHFLLSDTVDPDQLTSHFSKRWSGTIPATFVFRDGKKIGEFRGAREAHALDAVEKALHHA